jgi:hypothetical protein
MSGVGGRWAVLLLLVLVGCSRKPAPSGPGAREAAQRFYEALVRQDWPQAYGALSPDSQARWSPEAFAELARAYRRNLGFDPAEVRVRSCDEQGEKAIAHVVLIGRAGVRSQRYNDASMLQRTHAGWRVILPESFGRTSP